MPLTLSALTVAGGVMVASTITEPADSFNFTYKDGEVTTTKNRWVMHERCQLYIHKCMLEGQDVGHGFAAKPPICQDVRLQFEVN